MRRLDRWFMLQIGKALAALGLRYTNVDNELFLHHAPEGSKQNKLLDAPLGDFAQCVGRRECKDPPSKEPSGGGVDKVVEQLTDSRDRQENYHSSKIVDDQTFEEATEKVQQVAQ